MFLSFALIQETDVKPRYKELLLTNMNTIGLKYTCETYLQMQTVSYATLKNKKAKSFPHMSY